MIVVADAPQDAGPHYYSISVSRNAIIVRIARLERARNNVAVWK
jgi:hypothetical protein